MDLGNETNISQPYTQEDGDPKHLGFIYANIIGLRYCSGPVRARQMVAFLREPLHPHSPNAIKVLNTRSVQVGYIDWTVADALSPLIDSELITVKAFVPNRRSKTDRSLSFFALCRKKKKPADSRFKSVDERLTAKERVSRELEPPESVVRFLGFINANIIGLGHCSGAVHAREMVAFLREPLHPHSPNAIKVLNTRSVQVGYIEWTVADALSPLIDCELITVEAIVPNRRSKTDRSLLCQIHIFAPLPSFPTVTQLISERGLHLITRNDASFKISVVTVKETPADSRFKSVDEIFRRFGERLTAKERVSHALEPPESVVRSKLMEHQKEGLWWLLNREESKELPPFWEEREGGEFVNVLTNSSTCLKPEPLRGGILADEMGLGKTLTLLSLIALDKDSGERKGKKRRKIEIGESSATLVVCPPPVFSTWILQLEEHIVPGSLRTYMYHGDKRAKNAEDLMDYDLVLTTYSTLAVEADDPHSPVKKVVWRRIILDEAHGIKNSYAQQSKMVISLNAKRRWAVTGTPIHNGSVDLFSLVAFLHFEPFSEYGYWRSLVRRPLSQGLPSGLSRLQVLMAAISLRRTKDKGLLGLPPKTIETQYVELNSEERELYDQVKEHVTRSMNFTFFIGVKSSAYALSMLFHLCQICTDLALVPNDLATTFCSTNIEEASNNPQLLQKLVEMLQDGVDYECPICTSPSADIIITRCAHIFCRVCILTCLRSRNSCCPLCRQALSGSDLFSAPLEPSKAESTASSSSWDKKLSSKTSALIKFLKESREQKPAAKSVVFSQFRKLLVLLEAPLKEAGFKALRIDGSMTPKQRANVIDQFQGTKENAPTILLAGPVPSGAEINLTAATMVYFMEPWWNPAVEEQAMNCIHRIGQKEAVKIVRLVARDSIEEKILMLQEKKRELARSDFGQINDKDLCFLMSE
ncbi:putative SWI/SNF-related matrix-associated actin-dependent regulator of chromatin subfamily A member 3-like 1 [Arachis duranensis]|uniref:SWI/SNF-related matrix-associated actin-dependent regulator of chromatin subfamily A member 3-like 1 n=1 Tax=Arachis duranensis TaxID=130453 RepID=A0A6P4CDJ1_ARADU|nr:putative SWI/SNF-related matrix-associated actin-dependent regulator of chromatin subfamily A member 3-like 1 [Arachis duranensis]